MYCVYHYYMHISQAFRYVTPSIVINRITFFFVGFVFAIGFVLSFINDFNLKYQSLKWVTALGSKLQMIRNDAWRI